MESALSNSQLPEAAFCPTREEVQTLLASELTAYIQGCRWFAAKDKGAPVLKLLGLTPISSAGVALAELESTTALGTDRYLIALTLCGVDLIDCDRAVIANPHPDRPDMALVDAFFTVAFARDTIKLLRARATIRAGGSGDILYVPTAAIEAEQGGVCDANKSVQWLSGEQSNSSLIIEKKIVLKLIRRISPGVHPEVEMGRHLTELGFPNTCPLLGEVVRVEPNGERYTLCVAEGFVPNNGDAWEHALELLGKIARDRLTSARSGALKAAEPEEQNVSRYSVFAALIGRRLGELHVALAAQSDDDAFSPECATSEVLDRWINAAFGQVERALKTLEGGLDAFNHENRSLAESLIEQQALVTSAFRSAIPCSVHVMCTRIHGDFHLGQVLMTSDDAYIIDFEGEPSKPLNERRAKSCPLKDVAGMLRSFSYASATALQACEATAAIDGQSASALLERCRVEAEASFLVSYNDAVSSASRDRPSDQKTFEALLDLFLLEKAAYEICYEAANRPEWIGVPLKGFASVAKRQVCISGVKKPHQ